MGVGHQKFSLQLQTFLDLLRRISGKTISKTFFFQSKQFDVFLSVRRLQVTLKKLDSFFKGQLQDS